MDRTYDVMVAGHLCLDIIPRFPQTGARHIGDILRPGTLVEVKEAAICTGGPVSNTGIGLKRLGNTVCFNAQVGDDVLGAITLDLLKRNGNAEGVHVVAGTASSYTVALVPPGIDRIFLHNPGANNDYSADDLDPALIAQCRHFHFGYPPLMRRIYENEGKELQRVFRTAKEAGATTSCDMSLPDPASDSGKAPWLAILENVLPYVDIFLPSVEEALYMLEPDVFLRMKKAHQGADLIDVLTSEDYSRLADKFLRLGARMASLKSGHRGFYLKTGPASVLGEMGAARPGNPANWANRELWCPAFSAPNLASATGSGDSSIAGFLAAFLRGLNVEDALKCANCVGWQNVQVFDAVSGIHTWEETLALLRQEMPMNELGITSPGWRWSAEHKLWIKQ